MSCSPESPPAPTLSRFRPPYRFAEPLPDDALSLLEWGDALIWWVGRDADALARVDVLRRRPWGVALIVVLPEPERLGRLEHVLLRVRDLRPVGLLPCIPEVPPEAVAALLSYPPGDISVALVHYLEERGALADPGARACLRAVFVYSSDVTAVGALARRLAVSRRTLGRHFAAWGLPAPSRWLQLARVIRAVVRLQAERLTVTRAAFAAGYPDAFTFSNQMKRLTGFRPSEATVRLGWQWVVEAWLERERSAGYFRWLREAPAAAARLDGKEGG
ncbi:MAG: helix-turn-helix domain-containing protein [Longimicrobiales bacterium]